MIKLKKPNLSQKEIIEDCIANTRGDTFKNNILASKNEIIDASTNYDKLASIGELSHILIHRRLKSGATKDDMVKLYDRKFVPKREGGRKYYDAIKLSSPNNRCPYCAQREVSTLDHYLAKTKYPTYAVTPYNLVPVCSVCNKIKLDEIFNERVDEPIHPYYDNFADEKWIAARMIEEEPIAFEFIVKCPDDWDDIKKQRARKHFKDFGLNELYKPYAAEEYTVCLRRIKRLFKRGGRELSVEDLKEYIEDRESIRLNTWQVAMYQAIIDSDWFWTEYLPKIMEEV